MPTTIDTIDARLAWGPARLLNSPGSGGNVAGRWDDQGGSAELAWLVDFRDLWAFLQGVKGYPEYFGGTSGGQVVRNVPLAYPWGLGLYAGSVAWEGIAHDRRFPAITDDHPYTHARVTVGFRSFPFDMEGDTAFVSVRLRSAASFVTVPGYPYTLSGGEKVEHDVGIRVGVQDLSLTLHQVPNLARAIAAADALTGHVNSTAFRFAGATYAAGRVLFESVDSSIERTVLGQVANDVSYTLKVHQYGHNQAIGSDGAWHDITPAPHPSADLNALYS